MLTILSAACLKAETFYVSPAGNNINPGTKEKPFRTIPQALSTANPGDTVLVRAGTYPGRIVLGKTGSPGKPVTLSACPGEKVLIAGRVEQKKGFTPTAGKKYTYEIAETEDVAAVISDLDTTKIVVCPLDPVKNVDEVETDNFRFFYDRKAGKLYVRLTGDNPEKDHAIHVFRDDYGLILTPVSHVIIDGLSFSSFVMHGISLGGSTDISIRNCVFSLCSITWGAAVSLLETERINISNCLAFRLLNGLMLERAGHTNISHVSLYKTRAHGVLISGGAGNSIKNSIIYAGGPSGTALYVGKDGDRDLALDYNCYLDYATANLIGWMPLEKLFPTFWDYRTAVPKQDIHSFSEDPLFVSTELHQENFALKPVSPCRSRGDDGLDLGFYPGGLPAEKQKTQ